MGTTLWLTGIPSSGKSTLGRALADRQKKIRTVQHLDGDEIRRDLFPDLGFDKADRLENIRRIGSLAARLATHDLLVIVSVIAPYSHARNAVRAEHVAQGLNFVEVHVHAPLDVCVARDVKGLYARAHNGEIIGLTGVDDVYEEPVAPEVRVATESTGVAECLRVIEGALTPDE